MIYYKLWIIWACLQCLYAESRKKELREHSSSARDSVPSTSQENPGSIIGIELTEGQKEAILQLHNAFRSMVKPAASNMLKMLWDSDLEKIAKDFSNKCIVAHNPDRHRLAKNYDWVGENIAWGTGSCGDKDCGDVYEGVKRWFSESNSYNYMTGQCSGKCTLYTQMVWWESNKLGCGAKKCGDRTILVCNYAPGGNYVGQRPYKSGPACSDCPSGMTCDDNLCIDKTEIVKPASKKSGSDLSNEMLKVAQMATFTTPVPTSYPMHSSSNRPVITAATQATPKKGGDLYSLPSGWNELPVKLTQVDSGMTSSIWGMNATHYLFLVEDFIKSEPIPGLEMHHISAGQAGIWGVGLNGNVFFRKGIAPESPMGAYWEKIHGNLKQIDSGPTGIVWGVNRYDRIFCRIEITADKPGGTGWMRIEGNMKYVSCGEFGCWAVDNRGDIYFRSGITEQKPEGVQWKSIPGRLRMIESGPLGLTVGLELVTSYLVIRDGVSQDKPEGTSWVKTELRLAHVTIGESGIIGILPDGTLVIRQDLRMYIAQRDSLAPTNSPSPTRDFPLDSFTVSPEATSPVAKLIPSASTIDELRNSALETTGEVQPQSQVQQLTKQHETNPLKVQDYNDLNAPPLKSPSVGTAHSDEPEKLHLTPEMASKILKLIEQKGNEFELDHHRAGSLLKNDTGMGVEGKTDKSTEVSSDFLTLTKTLSGDVAKVVDKTPSAVAPDKPADTAAAAPKEETKPVAAAVVESTPTKATSENTTTSTTTTLKQSETIKPESHLVKPAENPKPELEPKADEKVKPTPKKEVPTHSDKPVHKSPTPQALISHAAKSTVLAHRRHPTHTSLPSPKHFKAVTTQAPDVDVVEAAPKHIHKVVVAATAHPPVADDDDVVTHMHTNVPKKIVVIHKARHTHPPHPTHPTHVSHTTEELAEVAYPKPVFVRPPGSKHLAISHQNYPTPKSVPMTTKFNPLKTQTHRIWVHSLATQPPKPTQPVIVQEVVQEVVDHVEVTESPATMSYERPRVKAKKLLFKGVTGGVPAVVHPAVAAPPVNPAPVVLKKQTPAPLSWNLARSCCTIPDSVCPIPNDCVGYIECHGYRGSHKDCDRGKLFNPVTNICDYPRNVDCGESAKAYKQHQTASASTVVPGGAHLPQAKIAAGKSNQPRISRPRQDFDGVLREVWFGLGLSPLLTMLTNNPRFPTHPDEYIVLDKFEAPPNAGDGYGQRLSTYYKAPQTGEYIFYMSCDNECELWVSPDSEEIHSNLILELKHGHFTSFRQWHKYPDEQTSRPIYLQQDAFYFMESFMKEGTGGDDLSIGVKLPNGDYDLPISSNLHLIPGDSIDIASLTSRKPGQPVRASSNPDPAKAFQPAPGGVGAQPAPGIPAPVVPSAAEQPVVVPAPPAVPYQQPAPVISPQTPVMPAGLPPVVAAFRPDLMGPQPGQSAEQWLSNNHNAPVMSEAQLQGAQGVDGRQPGALPGTLPGAEMYLNYPQPDDMENFEQSHLSLKRTSVKKRSNMPAPLKLANVTAVR